MLSSMMHLLSITVILLIHINLTLNCSSRNTNMMLIRQDEQESDMYELRAVKHDEMYEHVGHVNTSDIIRQVSQSPILMSMFDTDPGPVVGADSMMGVKTSDSVGHAENICGGRTQYIIPRQARNKRGQISIVKIQVLKVLKSLSSTVPTS